MSLRLSLSAITRTLPAGAAAVLLPVTASAEQMYCKS